MSIEADLKAARMGELIFERCISCAGPYGANKQFLKNLHDIGAWDQLARRVIQIKFHEDQSYYYLGRAMEETGYKQAAIFYYSLGQSSIQKCNALFEYMCNGLKFPEVFVYRKRLISENLKVAASSVPEISKNQTDVFIGNSTFTKPENTNVSIATTSTEARRLALVIGNDSYKSVSKLTNAREDAKTIAESLTSVGYQVTLKLDLNEKEMKTALRTFEGQVQGGDEVMFFFAGHGVQLGATNYLLPTDIVGGSEAQVRDEAIQLQRVLDDMAGKKAKFTLAMIDACRDNPFKSSGRAIGGRGLAPTTAATGQMVIFSAGTGQQALDKLSDFDKNKNGLFTRIFVEEMQKSSESIDRVVKNVRNKVADIAKSFGHEQVPAIYDQVVGDFFFKR